MERATNLRGEEHYQLACGHVADHPDIVAVTQALMALGPTDGPTARDALGRARRLFQGFLSRWAMDILVLRKAGALEPVWRQLPALDDEHSDATGRARLAA